MKRLMHMIIRMMKSTIAQPFKTGHFCLEVLAFGHEMFNGIGCFIANIPKGVGLVTVAKAGNYLIH
jgi:hypothetical protein